MRSRFILVSTFSCREHRERAEQGMEVPVDVECPALAMWFLLVKEVQQLGLT